MPTVVTIEVRFNRDLVVVPGAGSLGVRRSKSRYIDERFGCAFAVFYWRQLKQPTAICLSDEINGVVVVVRVVRRSCLSRAVSKFPIQLSPIVERLALIG